MSSPPPPLYSSMKKPFERTAKTPFQSNHVQLRDFRSEYQPRVTNRFAQHDRSRSNHEPVAPTNSSNLKAKLGNVFRKNIPPSREPQPKPVAASQPPVQISSTVQRLLSQPQQPPAAVPTRLQPKTPLQSHYLSHHVPPSESHQPIRHLIQDTRAPNRFGPISTATKAPLSVSQYTQPTPSSNKSAQHVSRAHSEPSIKYQVRVNDKTYKILRKIGSGGSAKVYEGFEPTTYQTVAIKIINLAQADPRTQESYFNEKALLSRLQNSKHVVQIYNSEYKSECKELVIVMEKGDADLSQVLDSHFKARESGLIDGIFIKFYWRGMLMAVNEIHKHEIVHSDLKPVNFILVKNQIKLIDFGIASSVDPGGTCIIRDYQIGTINYMSPESLRNRALDASFVQPSNENLIETDENNLRSNKKRTVIKYNSKTDIWSLGCILYNLVYGRPPFDKYPDISAKVQAITNPSHIIDFPQINNLNLMNTLKSCLRYHPSERPSAEELLNDPYLKDDIVLLQNRKANREYQ